MTTLIATSVVRGSSQGESHGGVFLLDFDRQQVTQAIDWNTAGIDWQGRGWDRGLRGIAFDGEKVYIAASDELFCYAPDFRLLGSWRNTYLKHCHEICRLDRKLFLTSTAYDSILAFDLDTQTFTWALHLGEAEGELQGNPFDPASPLGPAAENHLHLNMVSADRRGLFISGMRTAGLLHFNGKRVATMVTLPGGTHNAQPWRDGVLFNDTASDVVRWISRDDSKAFQVPKYPPEELSHAGTDNSRLARQGFARGLCVVADGLVAAGSSPSTVTLQNFDSMKTEARVNLTMDIRNAIHGLELWPFSH